MRIMICNSRNWFSLSTQVRANHTIKLVSTREELTLSTLNTFNPDLVFFPHWNWIVPEEIYTSYECILFHTAPLPYGRGGSPIQNLILQGFTEAPVCAVQMTENVDGGPIYLKSTVSLKGSLQSIFDRINTAVNILLAEIIENEVEPTQQTGEVHTFRRLNSDDNEILETHGLDDIYDRVRMVDHPEYQKAYIIFGEMRLEFSSAQIENDSLEVKCVIKKLK